MEHVCSIIESQFVNWFKKGKIIFKLIQCKHFNNDKTEFRGQFLKFLFIFQVEIITFHTLNVKKKSLFADLLINIYFQALSLKINKQILFKHGNVSFSFFHSYS